jgi:hypothetical protein
VTFAPCPVCTRRWGKALTIGCCVCSDHVSLSFTMPGPRNTTVVPKTKQRAPVKEAPRKKGR